MMIIPDNQLQFEAFIQFKKYKLYTFMDEVDVVQRQYFDNELVKDEAEKKLTEKMLRLHEEEAQFLKSQGIQTEEEKQNEKKEMSMLKTID